MSGPGEYRPDPSEGITAAADLPPPELVPYSPQRHPAPVSAVWSLGLSRQAGSSHAA